MPRKTFKKIIVTDELLGKVNPKNKKLQDSFIRIKSTTSSATTTTSYSSDLDIFFCWNLLENDNKFFVDIRKIELADFFAYATEKLQWKSARFGRMRACLSSFSNFIENYYDDDYPQFRNIILKTIEPMPKVAAREKTILSEEQIENLKQFLLEHKRYQGLCFLMLGICSGARISEILRFRMSDIDEENTAFNGLFLKTKNMIKTKGRTKEGKMLYKYILKDDFLPYYHLWLEERAKIMEEKGKSHDYIFIDRNGDIPTDGVARGWYDDWDTVLGVPFYAHSLRHYIVTHMLRLGMEVDFVVSVNGWASSEMAKIYSDISDDERNWKGLDKLKDYVEKNK